MVSKAILHHLMLPNKCDKTINDNALSKTMSVNAQGQLVGFVTRKPAMAEAA